MEFFVDVYKAIILCTFVLLKNQFALFLFVPIHKDKLNQTELSLDQLRLN